jgi:hypothetical protein
MKKAVTALELEIAQFMFKKVEPLLQFIPSNMPAFATFSKE